MTRKNGSASDYAGVGDKCGGAMAAFEMVKKKTLVRIFYWRPDMRGYYHSGGVGRCSRHYPVWFVLIGMLRIMCRPDRKK